MDKIPYRVMRSARRTVAIQIQPDGTVLVRCPYNMSDRRVEELVTGKEHWVRKKLKQQPTQVTPMSKEQLHLLADRAAQYIPQRVAHYAADMGVSYGRITIRSQHTRWGSCSSKGNLNFNCLLMLAPAPVVDYVVVHELCHRLHMNHSASFWAAVEKHMPDYAMWRKWLKENGTALLMQIAK